MDRDDVDRWAAEEIYYSQFPEERPAAVKSSKETGKDLDKADKMTEKAEKGAAE